MRVLRYISDIHLELRQTHYLPQLSSYKKFKTAPGDSNYLALLGDIGNPFTPELDSFLKEISPVYKQIFYVPGNHEYYNLPDSNMPKTKEDYDYKLASICNSYSNVNLLNNRSVMLDEFKIIGTTLWSHIDSDHREEIEKNLNDYHLIRNSLGHKITTEDTNRWNKEAVDFITGEISSISSEHMPCIVLTHHAPLFSNPGVDQYTASPKYLNTSHNQAFHNDLGYLMKAPIVAWLYGHTHYASSFDYNDVQVGTNQLGYSREESEIKFNPYAHINLDTIGKKLNKVSKEDFDAL